MTRTILGLAALTISTSAIAQDLWSGLRAPANAGPAGIGLALHPEPASGAGAAASAPAGSAPLRSASASAAAPAAQVDENALRYYAAQNDTARVAAEIRRIRALHPTWNPPLDLFEAAPDTAEEQRLWNLYGEGKLDEILLEIDAIRERIPNWRPSSELVSKFEQAQARQNLVKASTDGDHAQVIALAEARPTLLACTEMDVMWRVAEALVRTGTPDKAFELYRFVLTRCSDPQERLATVQKASLLLAPPMTEKLLAIGARAGERSGFDAMRLDLARRRIGEAISGGAEIPAAELKSFEALAEQRRSVDDAMLLGWLRYARKDYPGAVQWFKLATGWGNPPKAIEGYALSLRQQGQFAEAEKVAYENRAADPLIAKLYLEILATELTKDPVPQIEQGRLAKVEQVVADTRSVTGSQALGWYHFNRGATQMAGDWFKRSVEWEPIEANVLGLALAAHKLKRMPEFKALVANYGGRFPAVAALRKFSTATATATAPRHVARAGSKRGRGGGGGGRGSGGGWKIADEIVALYKGGKYTEALAALDRRTGAAKNDEGLSVLKGWSLYHTGKYVEAKAHFETMDAKRSTRDTQYGKFYANERLIPPQFRAD